MDRIINVKVGGNHLIKDSKNAGVRGEANVTNLRITFDEGWKHYAKTVTFFDAQGNNPVKRVETTDLIEDITTDTLTYLTPIPKEALAVAGELTFVIDGYLDGKRQRSIADKLVVKDAPITDNAGEPTDPTPEPHEQLQKQIDGIIGDIRAAVIARNEAQNYRNETVEHSEIAVAKAEEAEQSANRAEATVGKASYIGENGNWYAWDDEVGSFYDTGVKAQAGSTVYCGDNPPPEADIWVDPNGTGGAVTLEDIKLAIAAYFAENPIAVVKTTLIDLPASAWIEDSGNCFSQIVDIANITPNSKVDLQPEVEQLVIFHEKDIAFATENIGGVVTIYCIGQKPANDYTIQATITEVETNG